MQALRTPEDRFIGLPDYPFAPHYMTLPDFEGGELRLHYVDEGAGRPVLLMHGEPTWSYLYRKFIPALAARGLRPIAPDLIGFGRSDKPAEQRDYSYERHVDWIGQWLVAMDLSDIILFCQDWGGLIGLRLVAAYPERFAGVIVANTGLPEGSGMSAGFQAWLNFSQSAPSLPIGGLIQTASLRTLSDAEVAAYDAPFPDDSYKAGARRFPALVPVTPAHGSVAANRTAWGVLERFGKPFITAFSDQDPITRGGEVGFQTRIPGARGQAHVTIQGGGHFLQEDQPEQLVGLIADLAARLA